MQTFIATVARDAGSLLQGYFRAASLQRAEKGAWDIVTEADLAAEGAIIAALRARFPAHAIIAEESGQSDAADQTSAARLCWLIDPLDGTVNFAHGLPNWGVSIALAEEGAVRYGAFFDPLHDELFYAERGAGAHCNGQPLRTSGVRDPAEAVVDSSDTHGPREDLARRVAGRLWGRVMRLHMNGSLVRALADLAAGRVDAVSGIGGGSWDCAAGGLLVREAGGQTTTMDGRILSPDASTVLAAATPDLHAALHTLIYA